LDSLRKDVAAAIVTQDGGANGTKIASTKTTELALRRSTAFK
jgi:hypothetical protein